MSKNQTQDVYTLISTAFQGDDAPHQLSVAIVSLVELCQFAMPDPEKMRDAIIGANFEVASQMHADEAGAFLALNNAVITAPIDALTHQMFQRDRSGEMVYYLLSVGRIQRRRMVFLSTLFRGAMEADAVKAVAHVSKQQPITGARATNDRGQRIRRVFWQIDGSAGIKGIVVTGPENVEALDAPRAFTAFADVA